VPPSAQQVAALGTLGDQALAYCVPRNQYAERVFKTSDTEPGTSVDLVYVVCACVCVPNC